MMTTYYICILYTIILIIIYVLYYCKLVDTILLFWFAFIITRSFGASIGDLLSDYINLGRDVTTMIFTSVMIAFIIYYTITKEDKLINIDDDDYDDYDDY